LAFFRSHAERQQPDFADSHRSWDNTANRYRFALAGNPFQLDLTLNRSDSFDNQIDPLAAIPDHSAYSRTLLIS
jgi:hypothetical protein